MASNLSPCRMILPRGLKALRPDMGMTIKATRQGKMGFRQPMKQEVLAEAVGITRTALSRIESGKAWPRFETLARIIGELDLEWEQLAIRGNPEGRALLFDETDHGKQRAWLGERLRLARNASGLSLDALAHQFEVSAAQLSRVERGQCRYSRMFEVHPDDVDEPPEHQRLWFADVRLREFIG